MKTLVTAALAWYSIFMLGVAGFGAVGFINEFALVALLTMATIGAVVIAVVLATEGSPTDRRRHNGM